MKYTIDTTVTGEARQYKRYEVEADSEEEAEEKWKDGDAIEIDCDYDLNIEYVDEQIDYISEI